MMHRPFANTSTYEIGIMATPPLSGACMHVNEELRERIASLLAQRSATELTLHDVRLALQKDSRAQSEEGELSRCRSTLRVLIDIDELIDQHGEATSAATLLTALRP